MEGFCVGGKMRGAGEEIADLWDARDEGSHPDQAAIGSFGLVSFGLLHALRRRSADSLERNARAACTGSCGDATASGIHALAHRVRSFVQLSGR